MRHRLDIQLRTPDGSVMADTAIVITPTKVPWGTTEGVIVDSLTLSTGPDGSTHCDLLPGDYVAVMLPSGLSTRFTMPDRDANLREVITAASC